ncbi:MAG: glycosyltransferase family 2 protein [Candidatus Moranbacteria bacterium]|nr:glycosyltransferase family 2 protein [Candidatus Moranbacteria bacterium]
MQPVDVSIAINSYKNTELLRLCIESIKRNVKGVSFEVIVVDGETEESTAMMMREDFPDVRFFSFAENVGFRRLVQKGLEMSRGSYALLLNSDIIVTPGVVEEMYAFLKGRPDIGMVGPKLLGFNELFQESCFRFYKPITILYRRTFLGRFGFAKRHIDWFLMRDYDHKHPQEVDWLMGSAMMVSQASVRKVGFMDERFFMYMEDVDWCRRFWENGYKVVYYPYAHMYHYHGKGSARGGFLRSLLFNKLMWYHIASAFKYFKKYRGKPLPSHD